MKYTLTLFTTLLFIPMVGLQAAEPNPRESKKIDLGEGVTLEVLYLPPGEFMMGAAPMRRSGLRA